MKNNNFDSCNNGLESLQKPSLYLGRHREVSPVCPKPRRLAASLPDFILPDKCTKHSQSSPGEYCEIMDIITNKGIHGTIAKCNGCPSSWLLDGSPPSRSDNPLIHDIEFIHQMEPFHR